MRALIVDDEKLARDRLTSFLRKLATIEVIGEASNGVEAVRMIDETRPDVVFLDVQMPGMDGFGVLRAIKHRPRVVFATAYDDYAIKAFEVHAADYLLKPLSRARLEEAVRRLAASAAAPAGAAMEELLDKLEERARRHLTHIPAQRGRQILVIPAQDVMWFEVEYRIVYVHVDGDRFMTNFSLRELEDRLDPATFFRAHKSRIVNLHHVRAIVPQAGSRFKLALRDKANSEIELSRAQARELRARMNW